MPPRNYRLYCLSEYDGINLADWIEATSDEEAVRKAREIKHGAKMAEIWERNRLIATIKGEEINLHPGVFDEPHDRLRGLSD